MNRRALLLTLVLAGGASQAGPLPEPFIADAAELRKTYGDTENVRLLATAVHDEDPCAREQAIRGLGEAHNDLALPYLRGALKDTDVNVRCAAAEAAPHYPAKAAEGIVRAALGDESRRVVLAALASVREKSLTSVADTVVGLLSREDPFVQAAALRTLTALRRPAPTAALATLAGNASATVRLRAAENALLLPDASTVPGEILGLSDDKAAAVRAAGLACLGRFAFAKSAARIAAAQRDPADPQARRGALWAYFRAGKTERIAGFLGDVSPMVRLAAIGAAGRLKCADCVEGLFRLLLDAPLDDNSHEAAREGLNRIGTKSVEEKAAGVFQAMMADETQAELLLDFTARPKGEGGTAGGTQKVDPKKLKTFQLARRKLVRNTRSCVWLLGELKSHAAFETMMTVVPKLNGDSPIAGALAEALGKIADPRAVEPLTKFLIHCAKLAPVWLAEQMKMQPMYVPYNDTVTADIIEALGRLKATGAYKVMIGLSQLRIQRMRLAYSPTAACRALPGLITPDSRKDIHAALVQMLGDPGNAEMQFLAAKTAARRKIEAALPNLEEILQELRPNKKAIHAAAWAIQQITGRTPALTKPVSREGGDWIVRKPRK